MKEVKITPPEGYEIDKENSTFDCIKFKPITKKFRYDRSREINGWFINSCSSSIHYIEHLHNTEDTHNMFATKKQVKSALAMAQISQIMANDGRFGGIITDEEWNNGIIPKHIINREKDKIHCNSYSTYYEFLAFHTPEQRDLFLKENEDLVKNYLML